MKLQAVIQRCVVKPCYTFPLLILATALLFVFTDRGCGISTALYQSSARSVVPVATLCEDAGAQLLPPTSPGGGGPICAAREDEMWPELRPNRGRTYEWAISQEQGEDWAVGLRENGCTEWFVRCTATGCEQVNHEAMECSTATDHVVSAAQLFLRVIFLVSIVLFVNSLRTLSFFKLGRGGYLHATTQKQVSMRTQVMRAVRFVLALAIFISILFMVSILLVPMCR